MFEKAIAIDPSYARAYAGLADCLSLNYKFFDKRESNLHEAEIASSRALELEPDLAEAHVARGLAVSLRERFDEAEQEFEQAMRLDPQLFDAVYWFARARQSQGRFQDALNLFERAALLRPEEYQIPGFIAQALRSLGRDDESAAARRRGNKLTEQHLELHPEDARACVLAAANVAHSDPARALNYLERAIRVDPTDPNLLYNVACTYAVIGGRVSDALDALEQAVSQGWGDKGWIEHDSDLDSLRPEPRYLALLQSM
jgi:tetratricopeptide (TPR) repeat protein